LADIAGATPVWRLLLVALLLPFGLGGLRLAGQAAGLYGTQTGVVLFAAANAVSLGVVVLWTVGSLRRADQALLGSEAQYQLIFDHHPYPLWVFDRASLRFLAVNEAAIRLYGWSREELLGMTIEDIRLPSEAPALLAALESGSDSGEDGALGGAWNHVAKDGRPIEVEGASNSISFQGRAARLVVVADVTERRRLEAQLLQAQKMEAVGQLAAGIAHEFNNLLALILIDAESLAAELGPAHPGAARLQEIAKAGTRTAELTRQLLTFSRKQVMQPTLLDLNEVLRSTEGLLRPLIGEDVALVTLPGPEPALIEADEGQVEQILVSLAVNSRDAMPHGGRLVVATANVELDAAGVAATPGGRPGAYVMLSIADTGSGMDAATRDRIFEPFFTTKEPGKGTGLGLASVHGIVQQSGGHITVDSEPGRGTTFKIYLPRAAHSAPREQTGRAERAAGGSETVLVVEDLMPLRALVSRILHDAGYTVLEASDPEKARMQSLGHDGPIHCLLTDVVMPHMSGGELALKLKAERAELKVVFMSGYPAEVIGEHGVLDPGTHFLQKPFSRRELLSKLRQALDGPPAAG
jgi:PAS domain S-box-containing protein